MERFNCDAAEEPQYAAYRSDPEWRRIYRFLHRGYWHVTSAEGWDAIRTSGAIKPNVDGRFPTVRAGITECSYGYKHGYVAVFDFVTPSEEQTIRSWQHAWDVLGSLQVLLRLDRRRLRSRIIPNSQGYQRTRDGKICGFIEHCEVWYPDKIPTDVISEVYQVPPPSDFGVLRPEPIGRTASVRRQRRETAEQQFLEQFLQGVSAEMIAEAEQAASRVVVDADSFRTITPRDGLHDGP